MEKVVVSLSGGMDSVSLLGMVLEGNNDPSNVMCVGFTYGSKHNPFEMAAARQVAKHYNVPFEIVNFDTPFAPFKSNLMLGQGEVPEGHYEEKSMEQTVVPGRNIIFAAYLAGYAWSKGASSVYLGVHAGDHAIYPDCRPEFVVSMNDAIRFGTDDRVRLKTPFLHDTKVTILQKTKRFQESVPYHLTRTCYKNQPVACGKCGSCQERLAAFAANNMQDPIDYESRVILPKSE